MTYTPDSLRALAEQRTYTGVGIPEEPGEDRSQVARADLHAHADAWNYLRGRVKHVAFELRTCANETQNWAMANWAEELDAALAYPPPESET